MKSDDLCFLILHPFFMVHTKPFMSDSFESVGMECFRIPCHNFCNESSMFVVPGRNNIVLLTRFDAKILVIHQGVGGHADYEATCCGQHGHERIGGRVREKVLFEGLVLVSFLKNSADDGRCKV